MVSIPFRGLQMIQKTEDSPIPTISSLCFPHSNSQKNKNKYIPTDTDKEIVLKTKEIYAMLPQFERVAYIWCIVLLLSVIIGLKTPIKGIK